jgi:SAM-dependent methyltransferase
MADGVVVPNEAERRRWNDPRWVAEWPKRERLTTSVTPSLMGIAGLQVGDRVLDIGCGAGGTTLASAAAVGPDGSVTGVDISEGLLALARARTSEANVGTVEYVLADMQTDHVAGEYDVALSQFGVMFFDEPSAAFANIRGHVRPGGRLVFACWQSIDRNPWHTSSALRPFLPAPRVPGPGKSPPGPFALGDPEETTDILQRAGFGDVRFSGFDLTVDGPADAVVEESLFALMGIAENDVEAVRQVLGAHLKKFEIGPDLYRYPLSFWVVAAVNP